MLYIATKASTGGVIDFPVEWLHDIRCIYVAINSLNHDNSSILNKFVG